MRKALTATTALVTAGVVAGPAAAQIQLGLDGYMNNFFGVGSTDYDRSGVSRSSTNLFSDGEIWFVGQFTADNGITFGANVQLESFGSADTVDEDFAYITGSFGRINIGSENTAAYLMQYSAPEVGAPVNSGWVTAFIPPDGNTASFRHPSLSTFLDYGNDENGVTYFTPRFYGFQLGATWTPSISGDGNGSQSAREKNCEGAGNTCEGGDGYSIGVNFVESFNGFDVAVAGGFRNASEVVSTTSTTTNSSGTDDLYQYSAGLNLGYAGFTFGGSFGYEDSDLTTEGHSWDVGLSYSTGPITVGASYFQSEVDGVQGNSEDDELNVAKAAVNYTLAPGVITSGTIMWAEWDSETEDSEQDDVDGIVGIVGLRYNF